MNLEFVTKQEIQLLFDQLLREIKSLLAGAGEIKKSAEFLRGHEVKKILKISTGTLQNLWIKGTLHPTKIGGLLYYRSTEIEQLLSPKNPR